jgi:hypothetical protein
MGLFCDGLFDTDQFSSAYQNEQCDRSGNNPAWQESSQELTPMEPATERAGVTSLQPLPQPSLQDLADEVRGID